MSGLKIKSHYKDPIINQPVDDLMESVGSQTFDRGNKKWPGKRGGTSEFFLSCPFVVEN